MHIKMRGAIEGLQRGFTRPIEHTRDTAVDSDGIERKALGIREIENGLDHHTDHTTRGEDNRITTRLLQQPESITHTPPEHCPGLVVFVIVLSCMPARDRLNEYLVEGLPGLWRFREEFCHGGFIGKGRPVNFQHVFVIKLGNARQGFIVEFAAETSAESLQTFAMTAHGAADHATRLHAALFPPLTKKLALAHAKLRKCIVIFGPEGSLTVSYEIKRCHQIFEALIRFKQRCSR